MIQDALEGTKEPARLPHGGLTDVGKHTGGEARLTAWPLACCVVRFTLQQYPPPPGRGENAPGAEAVLALWLLWLAEAAAAGSLLPPAGVARALRAAALAAAPLADAGHPGMAAFAARATALRAALQAGAAEAGRAAAEHYRLPPLGATLGPDGVGAINGQPCRLPAIALPAPAELGHPGEGGDALAAARARADAALGSLPLLPPPPGAPAAAAAAWLLHPRVAGAPRVCAAGFEGWAYARACALLPSGDAGGLLLGEEVADLERCFRLYRWVMDSGDACDGRPPPVVRSRETLACWALACLADRAACVLHPQLARYSVALRFTHLRWLSLTDGQAHAALQAVCGYLRCRSADGAMPLPVFSCRPGDATPRLAFEVAAASPELRAAWVAEQAAAAARAAAHWREVRRKQALASDLRVRVASELAAAAAARAAWEEAPAGDVRVRWVRSYRGRSYPENIRQRRLTRRALLRGAARATGRRAHPSAHPARPQGWAGGSAHVRGRQGRGHQGAARGCGGGAARGAAAAARGRGGRAGCARLPQPAAGAARCCPAVVRGAARAAAAPPDRGGRGGAGGGRGGADPPRGLGGAPPGALPPVLARPEQRRRLCHQPRRGCCSLCCRCWSRCSDGRRH